MSRQIEETKRLLPKYMKIRHWDSGPWLDEPDLVTFEYKGIPCRIIRVFIPDGARKEHLFGGHLCGYFKLPKNHPFEHKRIFDIDLDFHGGCTYSELEEEDLWVGFDCAHIGDLIPSMKKFREDHIFPNRVIENFYKDMDFVRSNLEQAIDKLIDKL